MSCRGALYHLVVRGKALSTALVLVTQKDPR